MAQRGDGSRRAGPERHDERLARWARGGSSGEAPAPAATVILLREAADELETLMLRRNSKIAFGGMWVFPGGRVDPEDAQGLPPGDDLAIARVAAAREAREEAGVALRPEDLLPLSHWTPPPIAPKRFLTWFFVASAPEGRVAIDHGEIREYAWMSASDAFARRDQGEIELAPPTFVTLHTLARWRKVDAALEALRARKPEFFATRIGVTDHGPVALWEGDAGWPGTDVEAPGQRHRLTMGPRGWQYERDEA
jgi:8-oxo-dGTP pyrophosphatase MutT (NUDIX family)